MFRHLCLLAVAFLAISDAKHIKDSTPCGGTGYKKTKMVSFCVLVDTAFVARTETARNSLRHPGAFIYGVSAPLATPTLTASPPLPPLPLRAQKTQNTSPLYEHEARVFRHPAPGRRAEHALRRTGCHRPGFGQAYDRQAGGACHRIA